MTDYQVVRSRRRTAALQVDQSGVDNAFAERI